MQVQIDKLTHRFQQIDKERMQGLPFYNEQLHVEALGFQENEEGYVGALITPWFINLILLFKHPPQQNTVIGHRCTHTLPSGNHDFMIGEDEELGRYDFISLASPVGQFKSQQQADDFVLKKLQIYLVSAAEKLMYEKSADEHPLVFFDSSGSGMSRRGFLTGNVHVEK